MQSTTSNHEDIGATGKVEENCNDERESSLSSHKRNHFNKVSSKTKLPSNLNRKRKVNETDILVDDSSFEEFERSLLSKLWKDVDEQNKVVWKVSSLSFKIINTFYILMASTA